MQDFFINFYDNLRNQLDDSKKDDNDYKEDKNNIDNNGSRKELQGDNQSNDDVDEPDDNIIPDIYQLSYSSNGAGDGNRTHVVSLEG